MDLTIFQIDAFADRVFAGNPAAVCPLGAWLPDETMQAIAMENNLSETAFFVPEDGGYRLAGWVTLKVEVESVWSCDAGERVGAVSRLGRRRARWFQTKSGELMSSAMGICWQ